MRTTLRYSSVFMSGVAVGVTVVSYVIASWIENNVRYYY